ncbi:MAG: hypothetical protein NZ932_03885 [Candidatus Bathyarchaeota archaeon]|nr:hypothetical protein [Candidatus Bathyarchaeota archaeon]MDW8022391.1 hypothetical protein [Nitrososphaerota archaeon]
MSSCEYEFDRLETAIKNYVGKVILDERWLHECEFHDSDTACDWAWSGKWKEKLEAAEQQLKEAFTDLSRCVGRIK